MQYLMMVIIDVLILNMIHVLLTVAPRFLNLKGNLIFNHAIK